MTRTTIVPRRIEILIARFARYVEAFDQDPPFNREQLDIHQSVIQQRSGFGSVEAALESDKFVSDLRTLLCRWRMNGRSARLEESVVFAHNLRAKTGEIAELEELSIDCDLDSLQRTVIPALQRLIPALGLNRNNAKIVVGFKLLHHLLPHLIPPLDRKYTGRFFIWHGQDFQYRQPQIIEQAMITFNEVARETALRDFVGEGWRTSTSKIIDNAIVAFCRVENLPRPS